MNIGSVINIKTHSVMRTEQTKKFALSVLAVVAGLFVFDFAKNKLNKAKVSPPVETKD